MADARVSSLALDVAAKNVKVSWLALNPCDVRVSWLALNPCDVKVSWLAFDTASTATGGYGGDNKKKKKKQDKPAALKDFSRLNEIIAGTPTIQAAPVPQQFEDDEQDEEDAIMLLLH